MEYFLFKKFRVKNVASAMKLGTDSVLLGAWAPIYEGDRKILDIGTGTGVVALMIAQRAASLDGVQIDAIDIDLPSVEEAAHNFSISPWSGILRSMHIPLQKYAAEFAAVPQRDKYDFIVSNPPYFVDSLKAPSKRRNDTRHTDSLPHRDLIASAFSLLKAGGRMVVILPKGEGEAFIRDAELYNVGMDIPFGLSLTRVCKISTVSHKPPKRYLMEFALLPKGGGFPQAEVEYLSINGDDRYVNLLHDYLITL